MAVAPRAVAQDAPPADDPVVALRTAANAATGDARAAAFAKLATALEQASRWGEAASAWREASAAKPSADAAVGEGRTLLAFAEETLASGETGSSVRAAFEDARVALKKAVALGAKDVSVRIGLARCLAADGRTDAQIAELQTAAKDFPEDPAPRRALGFALFNAQKFSDALAVLRPLSDAAPKDLNLSLTAAACARETKDEALALTLAERTVEHHEDDTRGWEAIRAVYAKERRFGEWTDRLAAIAKARPGNGTAAYYAGVAAESAQRWDDALLWLDQSWALDHKKVNARIEAARVRFQQKHDRETASAQVREVLAAEPSNQRAANLLSFIILRRSDEGDHAGAVRELEQLAAWRKDDAIVHANLGLELRWAGRYADSEREYTRSAELSPRDSQLHNDFGLLYLIVGRDDDARREFGKAHEVNPDANDGLENLGWMARRDGKLDEAFRLYRQAYEAARRRGDATMQARHRRNMDDAKFPLPPLPVTR